MDTLVEPGVGPVYPDTALSRRLAISRRGPYHVAQSTCHASKVQQIDQQLHRLQSTPLWSVSMYRGGVEERHTIYAHCV